MLIYVFDVESREIDKDLADYKRCLEALSSYSPDAKVFCLIHKMDLIQTNEQKKVGSLECFLFLLFSFATFLK